MKVFHAIDQLLEIPQPTCVAIGVFDGVHRGHQALIRAVQAHAKQHNAIDVIVTFEPHPLKILRPETAPKLLTSTRHKLKIFESLNVTHTLIIPFTLEFSQIPPENFIQQFVQSTKNLKLIGIGHRWEFGFRRSGNSALLEKLGQKYHFSVLELPPVTEDNDTISSTRIRQAVRDGNLEQASLLLGRPFSLFGKIVHGEKLGKKLNFPTANLDFEGEKLPPHGVYAGFCHLNGQTYQAAINIGTRPTVSHSLRSQVEAHLLDFTGDLYDEEIELFLTKKIREEKKFLALDDLKEQIQKDIKLIKIL